MSSTLVDAARELAPLAAAGAEAAERDRRLSEETAGALKASGLPRMLVPARFGGGEVSPRDMVEALEELAVADGSAAWCAMVCATAGYVAAYVEVDAGEALFGDGAVAAGVYAPLGRAVAHSQGYTLNGRWPFASFCEHSELLMGGARIEGRPPRLMIFPAGAIEVIDSWNVSGLRATGSHDIAVDNLEVPAAHSASLADDPREQAPLYAFPVFGLLALGIAAVSLGIARGAIDELRALATQKTPMGSRRVLSERAPIQAAVAQAVAGVGAARAFVFEVVDHAWERAKTGDGLPVEQRLRLRLAATHATRVAAAAVDAMYDAGGSTSIYSDSPLQRRFRDVHTATQHIMVAPSSWELSGRLLLGLKTDVAQL